MKDCGGDVLVEDGHHSPQRASGGRGRGLGAGPGLSEFEKSFEIHHPRTTTARVRSSGSHRRATRGLPGQVQEARQRPRPQEPGEPHLPGGLQGLAYSPAGDVYACIQMKQAYRQCSAAGSKGSLVRVPELGRLRDYEVQDFPVCSNCEHSSYCGVARGSRSWKDDGDLSAATPRVAARPRRWWRQGCAGQGGSASQGTLLHELPRYGRLWRFWADAPSNRSTCCSPTIQAMAEPTGREPVSPVLGWCAGQ